MPSRVQGHLASFPVLSLVRVSWFAALEYHYSAGLSPARRAPSMHKKPSFTLQSTGNQALRRKVELPGIPYLRGRFIPPRLAFSPAESRRLLPRTASPDSSGTPKTLRAAIV